ncbi:MAG: hypothetical protein M3N19_10270 [Candidatus Eremiobacteraeota bacterium]|nr:hypothetical protein [Candidatus Eremiobacteraeota bacterium]
MRILAFAAVVALAFTTPACSVISSLTSRAHRTPEPSPTPDSLVSKRGISMPLEAAIRGIAFHPYIPSLQIVDVALIAPVGARDKDERANRGIAFEYAVNGHALALSEWPLHTTHLNVGDTELASTPCTLTPFKPDGVMWTTPGRLLMTLQADGNVKPPRIFAEARRLLRRGACT